MRDIRKSVVALAATGITALGALALTGGAANAATNLSVTGCSVNHALLSAGVVPTCDAPTATIYNATQLTVRVDKSFLTSAVASLNGFGVKVKYDLTCLVNGAKVTMAGGFTATSARTGTQVVSLQQAVGSPEPNQCWVENLSATSLVSLTAAVLRGLSATFGVSVTGNNGIPGAIWAQYPPSTVGSGSTVCVDDTANGNAHSKIQAFQCEQDLADEWIQVSSMLVHNGDCMTNENGMVRLEKCMTGKYSASSQEWTVKGTPGKAGRIVSASGGCLSAPASGRVDGVQLAVRNCGAHGWVQQWKAPASTPV